MSSIDIARKELETRRTTLARNARRKSILAGETGGFKPFQPAGTQDESKSLISRLQV